MFKPWPSAHLHEPITAHIRKDFPVLQQSMTVEKALTAIRERGLGERIVYFYVIDEQKRLVGVLPTRRLLTEKLEKQLAEIMIPRVVSIPATATVLEACEFFVMYKFFAFPVIDAERRILGVVDVSLFTEEIFDLTEREQSDAFFETLGFRISQVKSASPLQAFRFRFPWLLATIGSGVLCALLTSVFERTLAESLVLAFFLTLVLGLGESVSMQSMTLTIQALHVATPSFGWYLKALQREATTAFLLGSASGTVVALVVWLWRGATLPAIVIGSGIMLSLEMACILGLSIPALLHALRLDLKIAAGPITLACTDVFTLLFYFSLAAILY